MNDQTTLADAVARAFRDHGITATLTAPDRRHHGADRGHHAQSLYQ